MINSSANINSNYLICATVKDSTPIRQGLIAPLVKKFFDSREIKNYEELPFEHGFSDVDFLSIKFDQIYKTLLAGIERKGGTIEVPTKYLLTLDKINCPQKCKKTDVYYDTIEINDRPFLFFIYIDFSLIMSELRKYK